MKRITFFLLIGSFLIVSQFCFAGLIPINDLTSSSSYDTAGYYITLSWTATSQMVLPDTYATFLYEIYAKPGIYGSSDTTSYSYFVGSTAGISLTWHPTTIQDYTFVVYACQVGGVSVGDLVYSNTITNPFLYGAVISSSGQTEKIIYYYIKDDAYMNINVYNPGTILNYDTFGYPVHDATYNNHARSVNNQTSAGYTTINQSSWNCRDDTGNLVANGVYPVLIEAMWKVTPDTVVMGSWWGTTNVSITTSGSFEENVCCYPNPAKNSPITFTYYLAVAPANITIEVFTITGELVYTESFTDNTAGARTRAWNCTNMSGNTIGSDIYIYRITSLVGSTQTRSTKKLVYIK